MTTPVQCRTNNYIHISGSVFVQIESYYDKTADNVYEHIGFNWTKNFTLTKKWRSAVTGDAEFMREFAEFCSNTNDILKTFCENIIPDIEKTISQIKPDS